MNLILLFPVVAIVLSFIAYFVPDVFTPYKSGIIPLLGLVMFGMGVSLSLQNFLVLFKQPKIILLGLVLQFVLMPLSAYLITIIFGLPQELLIGMILVGSCPGGTASNVICYLAKGDVALSIILTTASTFLSVILTPVLTWLYIGEAIQVPVFDMMKMIFMVIFIPVVSGILLNHFLQSRLDWLRNIFPVFSMFAIVLIIAIIVALNNVQIQFIIFTLLLAVVTHNLMGLLIAYSITRYLGYSEKISRTLAIEVGMQNSGLAVALASKYFPAIAALPGVIFSIWHNLSGACMASYWTSSSSKLEITPHDK